MSLSSIDTHLKPIIDQPLVTLSTADVIIPVVDIATT